VDSKIKQERRTLDFYDTLNALNCQVTLGSGEVKLNDFKIITVDEICEQQPDDNTVNVFKQWVVATGGKTI
jgi:hypothetical protein